MEDKLLNIKDLLQQLKAALCNQVDSSMYELTQTTHPGSVNGNDKYIKLKQATLCNQKKIGRSDNHTKHTPWKS